MENEAQGKDRRHHRWRGRHRVLPIKRYATPEEVAAAALFLVSDEARYITGHTLAVDGGFSAAGLLMEG